METQHVHNKVVVLTDSASDIPQHILEELEIKVVELSFSIGGETFVGNDALPSAELLRRMHESGELAKTSMPSVGQFVEAYTQALETADEVLSIHVSHALSGTMESALAAAEKFDGRVHVFDSLALSMSEGLLVMEAARLALEGKTISEIITGLEPVRARMQQITGFDSIEYLLKGGRIGRAAGFVGNILHLKPSVTVDRNGAFLPVMNSRGDKGAVRDTIKWIKKQLGDKRRAVFAVGYAFNRDRALAIAAEIKTHFEPVGEFMLYEAGPIISTHTGPGWGVSFYSVD